MILKKSKAVPKYLFFIIATNQFHGLLRELNTGSTIPTMTQEAVGRIGIPIPPIAEQIAIVFYLDRETTRIGGLTDKIRGSIDTLQEYRTALISASVTGKIDVRKEVA
jgi:restriction endonuclease S subunit